jgi:hypothetical protein
MAVAKKGPGSVTLFLYNHGLEGVAASVRDPRLVDELRGALADVVYAAEMRGSAEQWLTDPFVEPINSRGDMRIDFVGTTWVTVTSAGKRTVDTLSLTGFRGGFLKLRATANEAHINSAEGKSDVGELNRDLADFVVMFGP